MDDLNATSVAVVFRKEPALIQAQGCQTAAVLEARGTAALVFRYPLKRRETALAARAIWKGVIKIAEIVCPVAMYTAASQSERLALHLVNRSTGHRLKRLYVDDKTDKPVDSEDQVKGYETSDGSYVILEPEDIASAVPNSDKALTIDRFIACNKIEPTYFDKP